MTYHLNTKCLFTKLACCWLFLCIQLGFKPPRSRVAEGQNPPSEKNCARQNECQWHSSGLFMAIVVKCQMLGPAGRQSWLGENLQVSLPPSLCCLSRLCDVGHGTIHRDEQQDLLLVGEWRMEWMPRGKRGSRPNLTDIILRVAVATVWAKDDFWTADDKTVCATILKDHSGGFACCSLLTTDHLYITANH